MAHLCCCCCSFLNHIDNYYIINSWPKQCKKGKTEYCEIAIRCCWIIQICTSSSLISTLDLSFCKKLILNRLFHPSYPSIYNSIYYLYFKLCLCKAKSHKKYSTPKMLDVLFYLSGMNRRTHDWGLILMSYIYIIPEPWSWGFKATFLIVSITPCLSLSPHAMWMLELHPQEMMTSLPKTSSG